MATTTYYTGIDLHKRTAYLTTVDENGTVAGQKKLSCQRDRFRQYFRSFDGDGSHQAAVETTTGWYWVADLLSAEGVDLKLAHAKYLKAISYAKVKTDKVDSETLAQLLRADMIPEAHQINRGLRGQRDTLRTRLTLVERRSSALQSIKTLLQKLNVEAVEELPALYQAQACCHQQQADLLAEQIKDLERELHPHLVPDDQVQRLLWIPGVGKTVAFTIRLETGTIDRFPSAKQFFSYCRLVPGASDSGGSRRHSHRKDGNRYLKLAFSHAGVRAVQYYPVVRSFYERKAHEKPEAIARAIVAKEIARIAYHVLRKREDFNGCFKGVPLSRTKKPNWPRQPRPAASPSA
jgi:transposase